uniref:Uncharacterized protein n=1 Tax=Anopheles atroparvus TaxID=41427 RepID=A0A182JLZ9_ANOAO
MPQRWAFVLVLIVTTLGTVRSRAASSDGRIVGAHRVQLTSTDLPYICSVRQREVHRCSGTVLNPHWLLTSGSCVYDRTPLETLAVVCGVRMYRAVVEMALHPSFASNPMGNDLALLMLRKPLNFTSNVQPIPLYDSLELPGASCVRASIVGFDWYGLVDGPAWWNPSLQVRAE